jgi:methionyl-tRNA formyltransferase
MGIWKPGEIKRYILYGSGETLIRAADYLNAQETDFAIFTAPRQKNANFGNYSFTEMLEDRGYTFTIIENLEEIESNKFATQSGSLGLSFGAAWIFKADFIKTHDCGLINFHGTCLPKYRGGGGFSWRILNNNKIGYSTAHLVTESVDKGPILMSEQYIFPEYCNIPEKYQSFALKKDSEFVEKFLRECQRRDTFKLSSQNDYLSTYWPRLSTSLHSWINWSWDNNEIVQFIRAFDDPFAGAMSMIRDKVVYCKKATTHFEDGNFHPFQSGIIYRTTDDGIYVASIGGSIFIQSVKDDMNVDLLPKISAGDRFWTPQKKLEEAKKTRVRYTPKKKVEIKGFE